MRVLLFLVSVVTAAFGFFVFSVATSAIQEVTGAAFLIVAAILFTGAAIIDTLLLIERRQTKPAKDSTDPETRPKVEQESDW